MTDRAFRSGTTFALLFSFRSFHFFLLSQALCMGHLSWASSICCDFDGSCCGYVLLFPTLPASNPRKNPTLSNFKFLPPIQEVNTLCISSPARLGFPIREEAHSAIKILTQQPNPDTDNGLLFRLGPHLIRVLPATCITFVIYENMRRMV